MGAPLRPYLERAIANVVTFGDTDVFPFPPENIAMKEAPSDVADLAEDIDILTMPANLPGVGFLESVEIDVVGSDGICEVKAGDRNFRSIDFRQLLLACVTLPDRIVSDWLVLINPREGIVWRERAETFVETVSLRPYAEFVAQARYYLSDAGVSV